MDQIILTILQTALALLLAVQNNPVASIEMRNQSIVSANQAIQVAANLLAQRSATTPTAPSTTGGVLAKYVRKDWGISFDLPTGWSLRNSSDWDTAKEISIDIPEKNGAIMKDGARIVISYTEGTSITDQNLKTGPITYFWSPAGILHVTGFSEVLNKSVTEVATPVTYFSAKWPLFIGAGRWKTYITNTNGKSGFIKMNITGGTGETAPLDEFIKYVKVL